MQPTQKTTQTLAKETFHSSSKKQGYVENSSKGGDGIINQTPCNANHKWEGHHEHGKGENQTPPQAPQAGVPALGRLIPITFSFENQRHLTV